MPTPLESGVLREPGVPVQYMAVETSREVNELRENMGNGQKTDLESYRAIIDQLDQDLVHLLATRFRYTAQIGELKANQELPASDPQRENQQMLRLTSLAQAQGIDPHLVRQIWQLIHQAVVQNHQEILQNVKLNPINPDTGL